MHYSVYNFAHVVGALFVAALEAVGLLYPVQAKLLLRWRAQCTASATATSLRAGSRDGILQFRPARNGTMRQKRLVRARIRDPVAWKTADDIPMRWSILKA
jgi:hypothetical protein